MAASVWVAWTFCRQLLPLARFIDAIGEYLGVVASWLVLLACLVSAGNATIRYLISNSSNAWLELQWYMFGGMVLLGAAYTLKVNEHVRVDLIYGMVSDRTRHWIDLLGGAVFLMPMCLIMIWFTWPWFWQSWALNESSNNAGGLVRWPIKLLLPVGFGLILLQGISEMIKRAAALRGFHQHEYAYEKPLQ
ncbi:TRAP transporter small permease subunit [Bosea sp. 2KB_26]|uniref:TRAP transporter small permease subunit n=1 Tax=Bosea sp. 2KB_26 TaxID=3237475 RepID=UPI003F903C78